MSVGKSAKCGWLGYATAVKILHLQQILRIRNAKCLLCSMTFVAMVCGATSSFANEAKGRVALDEAVLLMEELQPDSALSKIEELLNKGGLGFAETRDAWALKGEVLALVGKVEESTEAFSILLRIDPSWTTTTEREVAISAPLKAARARIPDGNKALFYEIRPRFAGGHGGLELALLYDDMALVWTGALYSGDSLFLDVPLNTNTPIGFIPVDPQTANEMILSVRLLDSTGNILRAIPLDSSAFSENTTPAVESEPLPWMTISGTSIAAVSVAALTVTGIAFAAANPNTPGGDEARSVLSIIAGVAVLGAAVGSGLVVTDLLIDTAMEANKRKPEVEIEGGDDEIEKPNSEDLNEEKNEISEENKLEIGEKNEDEASKKKKPKRSLADVGSHRKATASTEDRKFVWGIFPYVELFLKYPRTTRPPYFCLCQSSSGPRGCGAPA
ncbi:MAG: hypothetical protein GY822_17675, partial [Deltaproteobacteria bacterium]|nr:hypothetical protein [Deltaproteobacteria bacterium]